MSGLYRWRTPFQLQRLHQREKALLGLDFVPLAQRPDKASHEQLSLIRQVLNRSVRGLTKISNLLNSEFDSSDLYVGRTGGLVRC